jgi:hypothetical protein
MLISILDYSETTIGFLKRDKISFEHVIDDPNLQGKLGFAMVANAMAAFDVYAWVLFQKFSGKMGNEALFNSLLNDKRFFDKSKFGNEKGFYSIVRCGVIHQLYPKNAIITAEKSSIILYNYKNTLTINAYALYSEVLAGIEKIHSHIKGLSMDEQLDLSTKLLMRTKMDEEEYETAKIELSALPILR